MYYLLFTLVKANVLFTIYFSKSKCAIYYLL